MEPHPYSKKVRQNHCIYVVTELSMPLPTLPTGAMEFTSESIDTKHRALLRQGLRHIESHTACPYSGSVMTLSSTQSRRVVPSINASEVHGCPPRWAPSLIRFILGRAV